MKKKIKILQFVSNISKNSGVMHELMNYYNSIYEQIEFDFIFFEDSENTFYEEIRGLGGKTYKISTPLKPFKFYQDLRIFCSNEFNNFDIFENNIPFLGYFFKEIKLQLGVKSVITHSHATKFGDSKISNFRNHIFFLMTGHKVGDVLMSCTEEAGEKIFGKHCKSKPLYIVNNAFDLKKYEYDEVTRLNLRKKMNWNGRYVIGNVGRFSPPKNHKLIIEVFAEYHKKNKKAFLVLIGSGILKDEIKQKIEELNLENDVKILSDRDDINIILQGFDSFIFPSIFEGLGIALVEAQVSGLPCLVSNTVPREANFTNYQIVNLKDSVSSWAKKLEFLSKKNRLKNTRELATKAGFDITIESGKLINIYRSVFMEGKND